MVDGEMMRVKTTTTGSNPVYVFRGILGSKATHIQSILLLEELELNQLNSEDILSFVLLDIHLNMLDLVLVTTQLHSQISKIEQSVDEELLAQSTREKVELTSTLE